MNYHRANHVGMNRLSLMVGREAVKLIEESPLTIPGMDKLRQSDDSLAYPNYHRLVNRFDIETLNMDVTKTIVAMISPIEHLKIAVDNVDPAVIDSIAFLLERYQTSLLTLELYFSFSYTNRRVYNRMEDSEELFQSWILLLFNRLSKLTELRELTLDIQSAPFVKHIADCPMDIVLGQKLRKFNINFNGLHQDTLLSRLTGPLVTASRELHCFEMRRLMAIHEMMSTNPSIKREKNFFLNLEKLFPVPKQVQIGNLVVLDSTHFWYNMREPQFSDKLVVSVAVKEKISYFEYDKHFNRCYFQLDYLASFISLKVLRLEHLSNVPLHELAGHLRSLRHLLHLELGYHVNIAFPQKEIVHKFASVQILTLSIDQATYHHLNSYPLGQLFPKLQIIRIHFKPAACAVCNPTLPYYESNLSHDDLKSVLFTPWQNECMLTLRYAYLLKEKWTKKERLIEPWIHLNTVAYLIARRVQLQNALAEDDHGVVYVRGNGNDNG